MLNGQDSDSKIWKLEQFRQWTAAHFAGLILIFVLALLATSIQKLLGVGWLSPLILAIMTGILVSNTIKISAYYQPGIDFCIKKLLRVAIALLGIQFSISQIISIGLSGLFVIVGTVLSTFLFTLWMGKMLGLNHKLVKLIAAGTSICGASAVIAANTVVDSSDEDVAYAIAIVTAFGTVSMIAYPLLPVLLNLSPQAFGIWCGVSIHEIAQVVAAGFQLGNAGGEAAVIIKLARILFLIPMVFLLGSSYLSNHKDKAKQSQLPIPWFMAYFILLMGINSMQILPDNLKSLIIQGNQFLLTMSLVAMGLVTSINKLKQVGIKPLYLASASSLFISSVSLLLIKALY